MSCQEEQEMEAEALEAIFEDNFTVLKSQQPFVWKIELWPEATSEDGENHVGISVEMTLPLTYPEDETALPQLTVDGIRILKGLTRDHAQTLLELAEEEAASQAGTPSVFAICERLREWLVEHNQKGHDDVSMHAQMLRRKKAEEQKQQQQQKSQQFESQKAHDEMTEAERDELELRRRRAEGTPVTPETFAAWKAKFDAEMVLLKQQRAHEAQQQDGGAGGGGKSKKNKNIGDDDNHKEGRLTGFQQFSDKAFNLEALEAAAENAQTDPDEEEDEEEDDGDDDGGEEDDNENAIQEELFDVDDEDLDDLDFDDDDDEEDVDI